MDDVRAHIKANARILYGNHESWRPEMFDIVLLYSVHHNPGPGWLAVLCRYPWDKRIRHYGRPTFIVKSELRPTREEVLDDLCETLAQRASGLGDRLMNMPQRQPRGGVLNLRERWLDGGKLNGGETW